jgi:hypothetical protein
LNFEKPAVGKDFIEKMNLRQVLNNGDTIGYAMGQGIYQYRGLKIYEHGGADAGYRTDLMRIPDQHFSVNVLSNLASFNPGDIAGKIRDIYLADKETREPEKPKTEAAVADTSKTPISHEMLVSYSGKYEIQPGLIAIITNDDSDLFVETQGLQKTKMIRLSNYRFVVKEANAELTFNPDENGKITKVLVSIQGQQISANRLPDFDASAVTLSDFTGEYRSDELNTSYTFLIESGKLVARHFRTGDIHLSPIRENVFNGDQWYFGQLEFTRDNNNNVTGFKAGSGRVKNLKFEKIQN